MSWKYANEKRKEEKVLKGVDPLPKAPKMADFSEKVPPISEDGAMQPKPKKFGKLMSSLKKYV
jgi:hypothetical protein